jgi:AraC-like DNA-binding protein
MHCSAAKNARRFGGSHIYTCPAGIYFWTSPFFAGEYFAGAFYSAVFSADKQQETLDRFFKICKGDISRADIARRIEEVPAKTGREVQALAHMMQLCAQHVSFWKGGIKLEDDGGSRASLSKNEMVNVLDNERMLLAYLRRGDYIDAQNLTKTLLTEQISVNGGNFEHLKLRAIELVVLLSRTGANEQNTEEPVEANGRFIKRIEESLTADELIGNMCLTVEQMAGKIFSFRGIRHASALRKAERFIWENYTRKISLKEVADMSGLSAPYFSTIFKDEMGENFSNYLNRLRVEKAAAMLRETECPISGISAACGFEDQSWFSKIFKSFTGVSPCKYREMGGVLFKK